MVGKAIRRALEEVDDDTHLSCLTASDERLLSPGHHCGGEEARQGAAGMGHGQEQEEVQKRSINESKEYELPEALQCSRKLGLNLSSHPTLARRALLQKFKWRRLQYQGEWVVFPRLEPGEVAEVNAAEGSSSSTGDSSSSNGGSSTDEDLSDAASRSGSANPFLGVRAFSVRLPCEQKHQQPARGQVHLFRWRRLSLGNLWICVPSLTVQEVQVINSQMRTRLERGAYAPGVAEMLDDMTTLSGLLEDRQQYTFASQEPITHVVMIVVVEAEVAPILAKLDFKDDEAATQDLLGLARVRSGQYGSYKLSVLKVAESKIFHRHHSGCSQASALAALAARLLRPSVVVSFGTAGGVPGRTAVGDVVLGDGCLYLDRLRMRDKNSFDWGLWGGGCMESSGMADALNLKRVLVASQVGYSVTPLQEDIIEKSGVGCLDMEGAPIAQILNQAGVNLIALKVISNGVYPGEPKRMESEYHENREEVSRRATEALSLLLGYLDGKTPSQLSE